MFILSLETRERNKGLNCISSTLIYVNKTSRSSQIKSWKLESLKAFDSIWYPLSYDDSSGCPRPSEVALRLLFYSWKLSVTPKWFSHLKQVIFPTSSNGQRPLYWLPVCRINDATLPHISLVTFVIYSVYTVTPKKKTDLCIIYSTSPLTTTAMPPISTQVPKNSNEPHNIIGNSHVHHIGWKWQKWANFIHARVKRGLVANVYF